MIFALCKVYLYPRRCSADLSMSSGLVSLPQMPLIILERVTLSNTSVISRLVSLLNPGIDGSNDY